MSTKSDTPRTDAASFALAIHDLCDDFARTLERELNAARERIAELEERLETQSHNIGVLNSWAETKTSSLRNRIAELEAALTPLDRSPVCGIQGCICYWCNAARRAHLEPEFFKDKIIKQADET